jgi:hypothetical protein
MITPVDYSLPAKLASFVVLGVSVPETAQQKFRGHAQQAARRVIDFSLKGGFSPFLSSTSCRSDKLVRSLINTFRAICPPISGSLKIDGGLIHLTTTACTLSDESDAGDSFALVFPVEDLTADAFDVLDEIRNNWGDSFKVCKRKKYSVLTSFESDDHATLFMDGCLFNHEVSAVLSSVDFVGEFCRAFRSTIESTGDTWCTFQTLLDACAQDSTLAREKPSFVEFYHSHVRSWDSLRRGISLRTPCVLGRCWLPEVTRFRAAHLVCEGRRSLVFDLFSHSGLVDKRAKAGEPVSSVSIVACISAVNAFLFDLPKTNAPPYDLCTENKPFAMGLIVWSIGAPRSIVQRAYDNSRELRDLLGRVAQDQSKAHSNALDVNELVSACALVPFVWPPGLFRPVRASRKRHDEHASGGVTDSNRRKLLRAMKTLCFLMCELSASPMHDDLAVVHWFAAYGLSRNSTNIPGGIDVLSRPFVHVARRVASLSNEPYQPEAQRGIAAVSAKVVDLLVLELNEHTLANAATQSPEDVQLVPWVGGRVDDLVAAVSKRSYFFELNSVYTLVAATDERPSHGEQIVMQLCDTVASRVVDVEYTVRAAFGPKTKREVQVVLFGDTVLLAGSRNSMEQRVVLTASCSPPNPSAAVDMLAWGLSHLDATVVTNIVRHRYGKAKECKNDEQWEFPFLGWCLTVVRREGVDRLIQNTDAAHFKRALVAELVDGVRLLDSAFEGCSVDGDDLRKLVRLKEWGEVNLNRDPHRELDSRSKKGCRISFEAVISRDIRQFAAWFLRTPYHESSWEDALTVLPFRLLKGPFATLCDGTNRRVDHPLWSVRSDLVRIASHAVGLA